MPFVLSGSTITQSGADSGLSGLSAVLPAEKVRREGDVTVYDCTDYPLVINGQLEYSQDDSSPEKLICGAVTTADPYDTVWLRVEGAGAVFKTGKVHENANGDRYSLQNHQHLVITRPKTEVHPFLQPGGSQAIANGLSSGRYEPVLYVGDGGGMVCEGANIEVYGAWGVANTASEFTLRDCNIHFGYGRSYWYRGDDMRDNITNECMQLLQVPALFSGNQVISSIYASNISVSGNFGGGAGTTHTIKNIKIPQNSSDTLYIHQGSASGSEYTFNFFNYEGGSQHPPRKSGADVEGMIASLSQEYNVQAVDVDGNPVEGAKVFVYGYNGKANKSSVTNGSGQLDTDGVVEIYEWESLIGNAEQVPSPTYFNKNNDNTEDYYDVRAIGYDKQVVIKNNESFRGYADVKQIGFVFLPDTAITEASKATVGSYSEIGTAQQAYDAAKSYLADNYAGEIAPLVRRFEDTIDAGAYDVVFDALASQLVSFDGTAITFRATRFEGNIATSGSVSSVNGSVVSGLIQSSTQDSSVGFDASYNGSLYSVHTSQSDAQNYINGTVQTTTESSYNFLYSAGTTLYFRVVSSAGVISYPTLTPDAAGEYTLKLSISEKLDQINGGVTELVLDKPLVRAIHVNTQPEV